MGTIKNIFTKHGISYLDKYGNRMPANHKKTINAIIHCKTDICGITVYQCDDCKEYHHFPLSCGNRHCPNCQYQKSRKWLARQREKQLPGAHFMITFTVPKQIRSFIRGNQKIAYSALFKASSEALKKLAKDPRHIGGDLPGFYGVLHTWGKQLQYHPHIHYVVAGCALDRKDLSCHPARNNFYLPIIPLGRIYKAKFKDEMKAAGLIHLIDVSVWKTDWNVHCKADVENNADDEVNHATSYLSNYVYRVAVSDSRVTFIGETVHVLYKKKDSNRPRTMKLAPHEFIRRFLQHVLPSGFMKIRYYGFMHPSCSVAIAKLRGIIAEAFNVLVITITVKPVIPVGPFCKSCGGMLSFKSLQLPMPADLQGLPAG